jgi:hypothetical protein
MKILSAQPLRRFEVLSQPVVVLAILLPASRQNNSMISFFLILIINMVNKKTCTTIGPNAKATIRRNRTFIQPKQDEQTIGSFSDKTSEISSLIDSLSFKDISHNIYTDNQGHPKTTNLDK